MARHVRWGDALGVRPRRDRRDPDARRDHGDDRPKRAAEALDLRPARPLRDGLVTSIANPKLAVFFVALFPQFVGDRGSVLPTTMVMAALIVAFDVVWYTTLPSR